MFTADDYRSGQFPRTALICNRKSGSAAIDAMDPEAEFDSPETIQAICDVLLSKGVPAVILEADATLPDTLREQKIEFAFNLAEGKEGRDREAQVPALLGLFGIPYMGSDATVMGITLDKELCKRVLSTFGIRTAHSVVVYPGDLSRLGDQIRSLRFPLLLKPNTEGSGKGILENCIVASVSEAEERIRAFSARPDDGIMLEEFLPGREFTVALLGNGEDVHVFAPMEILFRGPTQGENTVYSYKIKKDYTQYVDYECPANLPTEISAEIMESARTAFLALGCRDIARIDFRMNANGEPCFLEVNPLPGLAPHYSDYPFIAESEGYTFCDIVFAIYQTALQRVYGAEV
ncbi:MAG: ATP-grasp domain-containing protein [Clostridia bacterium]|nr:ATP-grasp domain-containing protein [Clostridia bacterium]